MHSIPHSPSAPAGNTSRPPRSSSKRGSVLLVAMVLAAAVAVVVGSYLQLGRGTLVIANRAYYANVAVNLAESGLEEAMWTVNNDDWAGWKSGPTGSKLFTKTVEGFNDSKFDFGSKVAGTVRILVDTTTETSPQIVARATLTPPRGGDIEKWLKVTLAMTPGRERRIVARNRFIFSGGNAEVLAYDSRDGEPGGSNLYDDVTVTSLSQEDDAFNLSNSKVFGFVAIGSSQDQGGLTKNPKSIIGKFGDADGTVREDRITYDAKMNLPDVTAPTPTLKLDPITTAQTISTSGIYAVESIALSGSDQLIIADGVQVELVVTPAVAYDTAVKTSGNAAIVVPKTSSLKIYTSATVHIAGNAIMNSGVPANFELLGTQPKYDSNGQPLTPQSITVNGNGSVKAVIYAPNGNITIDGGGANKDNLGDILGSAVGYNVTLRGNSRLYWDKALAAQSAATVLRVDKWSELTTAELRAEYAKKLNF